MPTSSAKMAAMPKKIADPAKSFVRLGNKKQSLSKTKVPSTIMKYPVTILNEGMSSCTKCNNVDKSNMINCLMCLGWYHYQCQSLKFSDFNFSVKNPHFPYMCKDCCVFVSSHFGKYLREVHEKLQEKVSQVETDISSLDCRIKAIEQQNKFNENIQFQEAVNMQIEKHIENIKKELKLMENGFDKASHDNKADVRSYQCRKKRIVIFGMPNTSNDFDTVQLLSEELGLGRMNIKRIFRINSNTNDQNIAPPLNVEFLSMEDKWKIMDKNTREKIRRLPTSTQFHGISVAPDRSYQERLKYRLLRDEMNQRNAELLNGGIANEIWIIRKMSLEKLVVKQNEE